MIHIHIDVDNLWIYEQEYSLSLTSNRTYIYTQALPLFLELLKKVGATATFFIIGQDLLIPECRNFCLAALQAGHDLGNHSWSHDTFFHRLSKKQKRAEIIKTHLALTKVCKQKPICFRGPGYYQDEEIIETLQQLGYHYDTSVLPGFAPIIMKVYSHLQGGANKEKAFGRLGYVFAPQTPFFLKGRRPLLELPISVFPFILLPIHTTFAYFFGAFYRRLISLYLKTKPSYLLYVFHAIDLVDLPAEKNHPVIPLRFPFSERVAFVEKMLLDVTAANGQPITTNRREYR